MNPGTWVAPALVACLLTTGSTDPAAARPRPTRYDAVQSEIDRAVHAGVPGIVYLLRDGKRIRILTAGVGNVRKGTPIRPDDRFRIASITKSFVAVTLLRLVAEHRLALDDTVDHWVPGLLPDPSITVRQLLGHTSGLFDYAEDPGWQQAVAADPARRWAPQEVLDVSLSHPPDFAPGTSYGYSNTGYVVLGMVAQAVTGKPMAQLVTRRVIRPLHLADTYVAHTPRIRGRHAHGYSTGGFLGSTKSGLKDVTRMSATLALTSGDVISTVSDVARFFRALFDGELLPAPLLAQMETFHPTGEGDGWGYGLGLQQNPNDCGTSIGHTGGIFGFSSDAGESPDHKHQLVVFANTDSIPRHAFKHFARATHLSYCGR